MECMGTDATRVIGGKTAPSQPVVGVPERSPVPACHTRRDAAGLETAQLNGSLLYAQTGRTANQLATLMHRIVQPRDFDGASSAPSVGSIWRGRTLAERARAYLHTNCRTAIGRAAARPPTSTSAIRPRCRNQYLRSRAAGWRSRSGGCAITARCGRASGWSRARIVATHRRCCRLPAPWWMRPASTCSLAG